MSEFMDEAKNVADKDPSLANKGLDEATKMAEDKTGGKFDSQIQEGEQKAEGAIGTDQGGQNPNQ
jgi:MT0933-like antitoxin protein